MPQMLKPVFISLVGIDQATDQLFETLKARVPRIFPTLSCAFLDTPFKDYSNLKIGNRSKSDFSPEARLCLRWGLFLDHIDRHVRPVFERGDNIIVIRQFGYDLYAGAIAVQAGCPRSLPMHEKLVPFGVGERGICPPLYVFTGPLLHTQYFKLPGQRYATVEPKASAIGKAKAIVAIIQNELGRTAASAAA